MAATRCDHQRPLGELLAAHVGEVHVIVIEPLIRFLDARLHRGQLDLARQQANRLRQIVDREDFDFLDDGRLAGVCRRHQQSRQALFCRRHGH